MEHNVTEKLKGLGLATLSDALDRLGIEGQALGLRSMASGSTFAGPAFTVRMVPVGQSGGNVGDYIDDVPSGYVILLDNHGRMDCTVWGDILTHVACRRGIAGTVIDGVCRDAKRSRELGYPLFARGNTMRTGKDRATADSINSIVQLAGVRVEPGDWLVGDEDGVVAIPAIKVEAVIRVAEEIHEAEDNIRRAVDEGARLVDARRSFRYHRVQSKT
jgi:4-hydroxy-4-methyl-2-oxoglutarate aldolase